MIISKLNYRIVSDPVKVIDSESSSPHGFFSAVSLPPVNVVVKVMFSVYDVCLFPGSGVPVQNPGLTQIQDTSPIPLPGMFKLVWTSLYRAAP